MPGAHHLPSELPSSACWSSGPVMALVLTGRGADTTGGTTLASPEWTHITFTYEHALVLGCEGWQVYDEGGFDRIIFDMWRDPDDEFMRLQATYPDDSIYQLLFEGQRRGWRRAWALGTDHGRRAGYTLAETAGSSSTVFAGETWLDHSPGPAIRFLTPLEEDQLNVLVHPSDSGFVPAVATESTERGTTVRWFRHQNTWPEATATIWYGIDPATSQLTRVDTEFITPFFEAEITIAVTAVDSKPVEPGMFEPTGYDPVWDTERPVVTTAPAAP